MGRSGPLLDKNPGLLELGVDESKLDNGGGTCDVGNGGFDVEIC
jgi:hypothetical protein